MRIGEIIGTVTLNRAHPALNGAVLRLAVPFTFDELTGKSPLTSEPLVLLDELGAGIGSRVAISEGSEAAQPFNPNLVPIDAYNAAILDAVHITYKPKAN